MIASWSFSTQKWQSPLTSPCDFKIYFILQAGYDNRQAYQLEGENLASHTILLSRNQ